MSIYTKAHGVGRAKSEAPIVQESTRSVSSVALRADQRSAIHFGRQWRCDGRRCGLRGALNRSDRLDGHGPSAGRQIIAKLCTRRSLRPASRDDRAAVSVANPLCRSLERMPFPCRVQGRPWACSRCSAEQVRKL